MCKAVEIKDDLSTKFGLLASEANVWSIWPVWSWTWTAAHRGSRSRPPGRTTASTTPSPWQHCRPASGRTVSALRLRTWLNRTRTKPEKSADCSALCCQAVSERLFRLKTTLPVDSFSVKSAAGRAFIVFVSTDWEGGANFVSFNIFLCLPKALWFDVTVEIWRQYLIFNQALFTYFIFILRKCIKKRTKIDVLLPDC